MSTPTEHWSDCAVHNEPAMPAGPCDCGGLPAEPEEDDRFARELREAYATGEAMNFARVLSGRLRQMDKRAKAANIRADNAERQCRLAKDMLAMERAARKALEDRPVP